MQTFFAPAQRAEAAELERDLGLAGTNRVVQALLDTVGGLVAVLNDQRQVVLANEALLGLLGHGDSRSILGLRPGEIIGCTHAREGPGGCGTGRHCSTCGAAIAIVVSLATGVPVERRCVVTVDRSGRTTDLCLAVRASILELEGRRFVVLLLQDVTMQQRWAALERIFFHDLSNLIAGLQASSELLGRLEEKEMRSLALQIQELVSRLSDEVSIQKTVLEDCGEYQSVLQQIYLEQVVQELTDLFSHHPAAAGKRLRFVGEQPARLVTTDPSLLLRVLGNMLTNAFEATEEGGEVLWWIESEGKAVTFSVWNVSAISPDVQLRVFQRNFSTKPEPGRGLGTYAMKLLGDHFLGGDMTFSSSEDAGTVFRFRLPV